MRKARPLTLLAALAALAPGAPASGAAALFDNASLALGGYARSLAGVQKLDLELAPGIPSNLFPEHFSLSSTVLRVEWKAALGDHVLAEAHQRIYLRLNTETLVFGGQRLGLGASVVPTRSVNLRSVVYEEDRLLFEHDIDRLALRLTLGDFDITLGRQAITWGISELFPVADLFTNFSPFELDTTQKRGIDALRILYSRGRLLEIELIVADRGSVRDLSGGLRVAIYGSGADFYFAVAKQWEEVLAFSGVSATVGSFKLRLEIAEPFDVDRRALAPPRGSLGVDWLLPNLTLSLEGHYNGTGVPFPSEYLGHYQSSPALKRGESYLLGRWYAGAGAVWKISELFQLSVSSLCNLQDPSAVVAGALTYQITQGTELSLGMYQGIGKKPLIKLQSELRSEGGSAGSMYYLALASFF